MGQGVSTLRVIKFLWFSIQCEHADPARLVPHRVYQTIVKMHSSLDNNRGPNASNSTFPKTTKWQVRVPQAGRHHLTSPLRPTLAWTKVLAPSPKVSKPQPLSQVNAPLDFKLLDRALTGAILKLATIDVGDEAVDFHCEHTVLLGDYFKTILLGDYFKDVLELLDQNACGSNIRWAFGPDNG